MRRGREANPALAVEIAGAGGSRVGNPKKLCGLESVEDLAEVESVNDERHRHMKVLRAAQRPENQLPIINPASV